MKLCVFQTEKVLQNINNRVYNNKIQQNSLRINNSNNNFLIVCRVSEENKTNYNVWELEIINK